MNLFKNILYIAEASVEHVSELERVVSLAENSQSNLTVIDIIPKITSGIGLPVGGTSSIELQAAMKEKRLRELEFLVAPYQQRHSIEVNVLVGSAFLETIRAVLLNHYDLVIKPAENPHFIKRLFGSNDMHLLRKCPCPVWLMQPKEKLKYACVLAAVDLDVDRPDMSAQNLNAQILEIASSLSIYESAEMHFVYVWDAPAEMSLLTWSNNPEKDSLIYIDGLHSRNEKAFQHFSKQMRNHLGAEVYDHLSPQFHLKRGAPSSVIPEIAKQLQADMVVMGTVGRTGIPGFIIGNTAESILEQLECSVIAVKPDGFVTPVTLPN